MRAPSYIFFYIGMRCGGRCADMDASSKVRAPFQCLELDSRQPEGQATGRGPGIWFTSESTAAQAFAPRVGTPLGGAVYSADSGGDSMGSSGSSARVGDQPIEVTFVASLAWEGCHLLADARI